MALGLFSGLQALFWSKLGESQAFGNRDPTESLNPKGLKS